MSSDISRQTFDHKRHYSQVVAQQGRVQLDADWNEQQDMLQYRTEMQTMDMVGRSGVPQIGGGFKIVFTPDGNDLLISPGRIYVDGILCELDEATPVAVQAFHEANGVKINNTLVDGLVWQRGQWVELLNKDLQPIRCLQIGAVLDEEKTGLLVLIFHTNQSNPGINNNQKSVISGVRRVLTYTTQPHYPNPAFTTNDSDLPKLEFTSEQILLLAYLDVWQRTITAFDDARIREVALDGPDTSTRIQILWQLKILPIKLSNEHQKLLQEDREKSKKHAELESELEKLEAYGPTSPESKTSLRIKEIHAELRTVSSERERLADEIVGKLAAYDCDYISDEWKNLLKALSGTLNVTTCDVDNPESSGFLGLQNQLYRVEIHEVTTDGTPLTFKWARDNASVVSLAEIKADTITVPGTGQGGILNFSREQFVEVVNDQSELNAQPGMIAQITRVDTLSNQLALDSSLGSDGAQIKIRLWDGKDDVVMNEEWISLDGGIRIQFSEGTYKSGDYWLIPARTSTKEVEWPPFQIPNTQPVPQPRRGIHHHYSRLARIRPYQGPGQRYNKTTHDCRRRFNPLPEVVDAIHIVGINWDNDSINPRHTLRNGLKIALDTVPEQQYPQEAEGDPGYPEGLAEDSLIVTLEVHLPGGTEGIFIIDGLCEIKSNFISWHWDWEDKEGVIAKLFKNMDKLNHRIFDSPRHFIRVRVQLKGYTIWHTANGRRIYLDGQTFGVTGGDRASGGRKRTRTALQFPSGAGVKASDFESWFYIRE